MKLMLAEPRLLKESISIISELVNEVTFKVDKDKIELIAMDPANVAMILFKLVSSAFVEYDVKEPVEISLSLDNLNQVLRRAKPSDTITLELEPDTNKLRIQLRGDSTRTFHLSLIDNEESEQKVPDLTFPVEVEMPSVVFNEAVEDMDIVSESVLLTAEPNGFAVSSEGRFNAAKVEISSDEGTNIKASGSTSAKYSIEYLKKIIRGSRLAENVSLNFNKDYPLKVSYKVMDRLALDFILAPRVDND